MIRRTYFFYLLLVMTGMMIYPHGVAAQNTATTLTLNEAISAALKNNKNIQLAKADGAIATARYRETEASLLPQVDLSYTAMSTNNPLNAFGFKLQQRTITQNDFDPALLNHPGGTPDYMTLLEVKQPLLNMDLLLMRRSAEKQTEMYRYKIQRTEEYITYEVSKAYLQLQLAYEAVKVLTEARETAKSVYGFTDHRYQQGLIPRSDLLNAQVHVTAVESNLAKANSHIGNASDYLGLLMGQPAGTIYKAGDETPGVLPLLDSTRKIPGNRSDFVAMQKAIEASGLMIRSSRMSYLPRLNAFGNYRLNDNNPVGFGANAWLLGVQLSWNVFNGNKTRHTIATQQLERDKLSTQLTQQQEQSRLELTKAQRDLSDAQYEIRQNEAAMAQATEALNILQNRYSQGLVNTTDLLTANTQLSQLKFSLAQARFTANVTMAYIQFLTTTTTK